jgi:hypothetical protein
MNVADLLEAAEGRPPAPPRAAGERAGETRSAPGHYQSDYQGQRSDYPGDAAYQGHRRVPSADSYDGSRSQDYRQSRDYQDRGRDDSRSFGQRRGDGERRHYRGGSDGSGGSGGFRCRDYDMECWNGDRCRKRTSATGCTFVHPGEACKGCGMVGGHPNPNKGRTG